MRNAGLSFGQYRWDWDLTKEFTDEATPFFDSGRKHLMRNEYLVLRQEETEVAGSSLLDKEKRAGVFHCRGCDLAA